MGLAVDESKTKYMLPRCAGLQLIDTQIAADSLTFDIVKEFISLGSSVTTKIDVSLEITVTGASMVSIGN